MMGRGKKWSNNVLQSKMARARGTRTVFVSGCSVLNSRWKTAAVTWSFWLKSILPL